MMNDDMRLLREYAQCDSEQAFATLVSRHVNLVYSVALRQMRDPHLAEEVTQGVFIVLARKAKSLGPETILSSWLCRAARYISADTLKIQSRRQLREQEAKMQPVSSESDFDAWDQIAPLLEQALNSLGQKEHDAIVLRFFDGKGLKQVGEAMGIGEDAARMRVNRAVEKLRSFFAKKGVTVSGAAIVGAVSAHSVQAAPAGLEAAVAAAVLSQATNASTAVVATTKLLTMSALQKALVATTVIIVTGVAIRQANQASRLRGRLAALQAADARQFQQLQRQKDDLSAQLATLRQENAAAQSNSNEVVRLRGELARLHAAGQNNAPANAPTPVPDTTGMAKLEIPKDSWSDAGFGTVEATLKTRGWSVLNGNRERFKESVFITDGARKALEDRFVQMAERSRDPNKEQMIQMVLDHQLGVEEGILMPMMAENQKKGYTGYQVVSDQPVSQDEHVLQLETTLADGSAEQDTLKLHRFGNDWKVLIDEDYLKRVR